VNRKLLLRKLTPYAFLAPAVTVFAIALIYPVFYSLRLSFFRFGFTDILEGGTFVGFGNYIKVLQSPQFHTTLKVTGIFISVTLAAELLIGLVLALLAENNLKGLRIFRTVFLLPIMIAPVVVGVIWRYLFNPTYGIVNYLLGLFGFESVSWLSQPGTALTAIILTDIWQWTPFVFLLLLAGLQNVPVQVLEASVVDGAGYFQRLYHVKLPLIKTTIGLTIVLRLIEALRALVVMFIMTSGGPGMSTEVLSLHIYKTAFVSHRLGQASTLAMFLILMLLAISVVILWLFRTEKRQVA